MLLMMFWILTGLSVLGLFSQRYGLQPLTIALIIRSIYHLGLGNTLILLGSLNVCHNTLHVLLLSMLMLPSRHQSVKFSFIKITAFPVNQFVGLFVQLINKVVFVVSFVGNNGTFIMGYKAMVMDMEFLYHLAYVFTSTLGLFVHELFYSILVCINMCVHTLTHRYLHCHL